MSRSLRALVPVVAVAFGLVPSAAFGQDRTTIASHDVIGACAPGDDLVGDFTVRQTVGTYKGREQLHLRLTGTITRTGTGVVGRYAETQLDKFGDDGSETYSGVLSRLVVPGRGVYRAAGHAEVSADGDFTFTPGLAPLVEGDIEAEFCEILR